MGTRDEWNSYKLFEGLNIWGTPEFAGAAVGALDLSGLVPGTETDGSLIKAGTDGSPISFGTAGQRGISIYNTIAALSGTFYGLYMKSTQTGAGGAITGASFQVVANNAVGTGRMIGLDVGVDIPAGMNAGVYAVEGMRIFMSDGDGAACAEVRPLYVMNMIANCTGLYCLARFEQNSAATLDRVFEIGCGGGGDISNIFHFTSNKETAWDKAGDKTGGGASGWFKVDIAGNTRYIQLYA